MRFPTPAAARSGASWSWPNRSSSLSGLPAYSPLFSRSPLPPPPFYVLPPRLAEMEKRRHCPLPPYPSLPHCPSVLPTDRPSARSPPPPQLSGGGWGAPRPPLLLRESFEQKAEKINVQSDSLLLLRGERRGSERRLETDDGVHESRKVIGEGRKRGSRLAGRTDNYFENIAAAAILIVLCDVRSISPSSSSSSSMKKCNSAVMNGRKKRAEGGGISHTHPPLQSSQALSPGERDREGGRVPFSKVCKIYVDLGQL